MGGGKGAIDHYVTPVRYGRLIVELGGKVELGEVEHILTEVAKKLPFPAKVRSQSAPCSGETKPNWCKFTSWMMSLHTQANFLSVSHFF